MSKLLLETDREDSSHCQYIWELRADDWYIRCCRDAPDLQWEDYNASLGSLTGVPCTFPSEAYPHNTFEEITEEDLFVLFL